MISVLDVFGIVGLVLLLGAFALNAFGRVAATSRGYQAANALGAGILAVYAYLTRSWVFLPLEAVWCVVATVSLVRARPAPPTAAR